MPSDSKKKEMQRKKDARTKKVTGTVKKEENGTSSNGVAKEELTEEETLCAKLEEEARINGKLSSDELHFAVSLVANISGFS